MKKRNEEKDMNTRILSPTIRIMSILAVLCLALLAAAFLMLNSINAPSSIHGGIMIIHTTYPIV
jgi:hypothetical protein